MKLTTIASLASLAGGALAKPQAAIYTYATQSSSAPTSIPTISPSNARLFLADKLDLSQHHSLADADEQTLALLASSQQPLFAGETRRKTKAFLVIEGVRDIDDVAPEQDGRRQTVATLGQVPEDVENMKLVQSFAGQQYLESQDSEVGTSLLKLQSTIDKVKGERFPITNEVKMLAQDMEERALDTILEAHHIPLPDDASDYKGAAATTLRIVERLTKSANLNSIEVVILAIPRGVKYDSTAAWGSADQTLSKRAQEEPLISLTGSAAPSRPVLPMASGSGSLVNTTMGRCSSSKNACEANTNSCSGHGSCKLKYKSQQSECWECKCDSKADSSFQYWGGAACQKRDISVQFWLFAGFGIFGTAAVTWAIGLLYSMGDATLPSVLSAGVAPSSRK